MKVENLKFSVGEKGLQSIEYIKGNPLVNQEDKIILTVEETTGQVRQIALRIKDAAYFASASFEIAQAAIIKILGLISEESNSSEDVGVYLA